MLLLLLLLFVVIVVVVVAIITYGLACVLVKASKACVKTSMPHVAVEYAGTPTVSAASSRISFALQACCC